jgi:hypothetical protein
MAGQMDRLLADALLELRLAADSYFAVFQDRMHEAGLIGPQPSPVALRLYRRADEIEAVTT